MNEPTIKTGTEVITDEAVAIINAARFALEDIAKRATSAGWEAPSRAAEGPYAQWYGKIETLAEHAGDALFDLLNSAQATGIASLSRGQIFNHEDDTDDYRAGPDDEQ